MKKLIVIIMALSLFVACTGANQATTSPPSVNTSPTPTVPLGGIGLTSMITSESINGLVLSLSLNSTSLQFDQEIEVTVDELNTLSKINNVLAAKKWPLQGLSLGPCGTLNYPVGVAIFEGYYTSANISTAIPLKLYDPNALYHCPAILSAITAYEFQPSSDVASIYGSCDPNPCDPDVKMNSEVEAKGCWTGSPKATYNDFNPGVYTVVGGDEWGALAILYFVVSTPASTLAPVFPPSTVRDVPSPAPVPWPDVKTYTEQTYEINISTGKEFAIGMFATMDFNFIESHDPGIINLMDDKMVEYHPGALNKFGTDWFLYKTTKAGSTEIIFQYPLEYTKIFKISIH